MKNLIFICISLFFLAAAPQKTTAQTMGAMYSIQSTNFLDRYIRHRDGLCFADKITDELSRQDATFKLVPALNGMAGAVSFESSNFPGKYLRHADSRLKLAMKENTPLFSNDASFKMVKGLATPGFWSFESCNFPGKFLRHRNNEIWLDAQENTVLFKNDATFVLEQRGDRTIMGQIRVPKNLCTAFTLDSVQRLETQAIVVQALANLQLLPGMKASLSNISPPAGDHFLFKYVMEKMPSNAILQVPSPIKYFKASVFLPDPQPGGLLNFNLTPTGNNH